MYFTVIRQFGLPPISIEGSSLWPKRLAETTSIGLGGRRVPAHGNESRT